MCSKGEVIDLDSDDAVNLTVSDLISCLRSQFRQVNFDMVKRALLEREESLLLENEKLLQALDESVTAKMKMEDERKKLERKIEELGERNLKLREENGLMNDREKRGEERYEKLKEELRSQEEGEKERVLELQNRIRDLEIGKREVEGKLEIWREKYVRLDTRVSCLEEHVNELMADLASSAGFDEVALEREKKKRSNGAASGFDGHGELRNYGTLSIIY